MADSYYEGFRPDPRPTDELIRAALGAEGWEQYSWTLQILQYRGSEEVFEIAREMCFSDIEDERVLGADILGQIGTPGRFHPEESIKILLSMLDDKCSEVIRSAAVSLGFHEAPDAIVPVVALKNHPDPLVRKDIVHALSQQYYYDNDSSIGARIALTSDSDRDVREEATASLTYLDPKRTDVGEILHRRLDDEDGEIRADALLGIACRKESDAVDLLIAELSRGLDENEVWDDALDAAGTLADPKLLPILLQLKEAGFESCWLDGAIEDCGG